MKDWQTRASRLRGELTRVGKLTSLALGEAVRATPRHVFVPEFYEHDGAGWAPVRQRDPARWAEQVYRNVSLVTEVGPVDVGTVDEHGPTSSSSAPGLMTRMIEMLDLTADHRVLEIGTGTGYNAALLCHLLGSDGVYSVDVDPALVVRARRRLAEQGHRPTLGHADGFAGLPEHAPFDRILATCAVSWIPDAWRHQLTEDGILLVDLKPHAVVGNLVRLRRGGDRLEGRFDTGGATFMHMRTPAFQATPLSQPERTRDRAREGRTNLDVAQPWDLTVPWFLLHLHQPGRITFGYSGDPDTGALHSLWFTSTDGSWAETELLNPHQPCADRRVWQGGPRNLWDDIETTINTWRALERPAWDRLGLTVTPDLQTVWLDAPTGHHWHLPAGEGARPRS